MSIETIDFQVTSFYYKLKENDYVKKLYNLKGKE